MAQNIFIYFTNGDVAPLQGVTGNPSTVIAPFEDGYYRDQYSATSADELYFAGTAGDPTEEPISIASPPFINGGIIPYSAGPDHFADKDQEDSDPESRVQIPEFVVTASDEYAHAPLRQVEYNVAFWAFPTTVDGTTMNMYFRQTLVRGWGNSNPNAI